MEDIKVTSPAHRQAALERLRTRRLDAYPPEMQQQIIDAEKRDTQQVTEPTSTGTEIKPGN